MSHPPECAGIQPMSQLIAETAGTDIALFGTYKVTTSAFYEFLGDVQQQTVFQ